MILAQWLFGPANFGLAPEYPLLLYVHNLTREGSRMSYISTVEKIVAGYQPSTEGMGRFRFWHVEPLLNQAADLLDRCLKERAEYNALRAESYNLDQSLTEAKRELEVNEARMQAGWLRIPREVLARELADRKSADGNYEFVRALLSNIENRSSANELLIWDVQIRHSSKLDSAKANSCGDQRESNTSRLGSAGRSI